MDNKATLKDEWCFIPKNQIRIFLSLMCAGIIMITLFSTRRNFDISRRQKVLQVAPQVDSCDSIFVKGRFNHGSWQPYSCNLHNYTHSQVKQCLRTRADLGLNNTWIFIGDSRVRYYFQAVYKIITGKVYTRSGHKHGFYSKSALNLKLDFYWSPFVGSQRYEIFESWANSSRDTYKLNVNKPLIIAGGGILWSPVGNYHEGNRTLQTYIKNMTKLLPSLKVMSSSFKVLWMLQEDKFQQPNYERRTQILRRFNHATTEILRNSSVDIWSNVIKFPHGFKDPSADGTHFKPEILNVGVQVLMNWFCNAFHKTDQYVCCKNTKEVYTG